MVHLCAFVRPSGRRRLPVPWPASSAGGRPRLLPSCALPLPPLAGARFPADIRRLQGELWDDELSLDFDSLAGDVRAKVGGRVCCCVAGIGCVDALAQAGGVAAATHAGSAADSSCLPPSPVPTHPPQEAEPHEQEESGETPDCSAGGVQSGSMLTGSVAAAAAAAVGPSNLGRAAPPPAQQREASGREGTNSLHPSGGTARASGSAMSGEPGPGQACCLPCFAWSTSFNCSLCAPRQPSLRPSNAAADEHSGIQGGGSAATTEVARSGAAAARTATSRGALVNLSHIRQRWGAAAARWQLLGCLLLAWLAAALACCCTCSAHCEVH